MKGTENHMFLWLDSFSFSKQQCLLANKRSVRVKALTLVDWRPVKLFGKDAGHLKSNQWKHILTSGILKFCIRSLLGKDQEDTLTELFDVVSKLYAEEIDLQTLDSLEYRVHRVLSLIERDFPVSVHDVASVAPPSYGLVQFTSFGCIQ